MDSLHISTPAKINLRLEIIGRRPDGYHELSTIFQKVGLFDELTITKTDFPGVRLAVDRPDIPSDSSNLAWRAAELVLSRYCPDAGVLISLQKKIPAGAGLGGGSSDAAAVIDGCNRIFNLGLGLETLRELALGLGADVPFFLTPWATANATGIGEVLTESRLEPDLWFLIVFPRFSVSTSWAYGTYSKDIVLTKKVKNITLPTSIAGLSELALLLHNDFEQVVLPRYPEIALLKQSLLRAGAAGCLLSGSGSSVFGVFENHQSCSAAATQLAKQFTGDFFLAPNFRQA